MQVCRKQIYFLYRLIVRALVNGAVGKGGRTSGHSTAISPKGWMNLLKALEHSREVWCGRVLLSGFHCMFWFKASGFDLLNFLLGRIETVGQPDRRDSLGVCVEQQNGYDSLQRDKAVCISTNGESESCN